MSKKIQLAIADPCHENWDQMTQADKGRFCASCQKQVIDFTSMSDSQIAAFFKKPTTGSVCGRFYNDQLERDIEIPKKRIPWVKYFFQFALPAFLVSMKATAQGNVKSKPVSVTRSLPACSQIMGAIAFPIEKRTLLGDTVLTPIQRQETLPVLLQGKPIVKGEAVLNSIVLKGRITDEDGNPVSFATIMIKGTKIGTMADSIGAFTIKTQSDIVLQVSSVGYETKEMLVKEADLAKNLLIQLIQLNRQLTGEVVVVAYGTVRRTMAVGGVTSITEEKKKSKEVLANISTIKPLPEEPAMIKIYPNPVLSGTSINVGCQKLKEGYYNVQLSTQSGQQVLSKQTWIDDEIQVLNIDIPHVAAGVYFLKLTNKETSKRFTQKIIIE